MQLRLTRRLIPFREPFVTAFGTLKERELIEVELQCSDGTVGYGEAAPLQPYDGVCIDSVQAALESYLPVTEAIENLDSREQFDSLLAHCRAIADLPQALAAIDIALWDIAGKRSGLPIAQLINPDAKPHVTVNATLNGKSTDQLVESAKRAVEHGYRTLKLKVGLANDIERVTAVRAAVGKEINLRIDANKAWSLPEAASILTQLQELRISLCEEPLVDADEIPALRQLTHIPLALDESLTDIANLNSESCDIVCLKISRCGGISGVLEFANRAWQLGITPFMASTFDGPIGIAAGLHAIAGLRFPLANGLHTLPLLDCEDPFTFTNGQLQLPPTTGLGVTP